MTLHPYTRLFILPSAPDADTDSSEGYEVGDVVHVSGGGVWDCRDDTDGAAVWEERGSGGVSDHGALTGLGDDDHPQYIKHSLATAEDDFLVASGAGVFVKKTFAQVITLLRTTLDSLYATIDYVNDSIDALAVVFAPISKGVTNGDGHDHVGGDGAQVDHGGLAGLTDDDHTQYIRHALSTAANDFLAGSGSNTFIKKTLAETVTILRTVLDTVFAPIANGVTNGDSHDHVGGDGAALEYSIPLLANALSGTVPASTTHRLVPGTSGLQTAAINTSYPLAGTAKNLFIALRSAQPGTGSLVVTLMVNGVASALTITIAAGSGIGSYSDTTHTVALSAADNIRWDIQNNASGASAQLGGLSMQIEHTTT